MSLKEADRRVMEEFISPTRQLIEKINKYIAEKQQAES